MPLIVGRGAIPRSWSKSEKSFLFPPSVKINDNIFTLSFLDIFPVATGPEAEEWTSKFVYAVVEILLDFINKSNDRYLYRTKYCWISLTRTMKGIYIGRKIA